MLKSLYFKFQIRFAQHANRLIYSVINFRPLRGLISEEWYVRQDVKKVLGILGLLRAVFGDILSKLAYFAVIIVAPSAIMMTVFDWNRPVFVKSMIWSFFFLNCMLGSFLNSHIVRTGDEGEYLLLNLMRIDPRSHFLSGIAWEYGKQTVCYGLLFLLVAVKLFHYPPAPVLWLLACYVCFRPVGEAVRLKLCERYGIPFQEHNQRIENIYYCYNCLMVLAAYGTYPLLSLVQGGKGQVYHPFFDAGAYSVGMLGVVLLAAAIAAVWAVRYLRSYPDYVLVARRMYNLNRINFAAEAAQEVKREEYQVREEDVEEEELHHRIFPDKTGYDYLHAIFFHRHKKLVRSAVRMKCLIAGAGMGIAAIALVIAGVVMSRNAFSEMSRVVWSVVNQMLSVLVFIMYCASSGQNLTRAMFYNCDVSLLKYGYYRTRDAILTSFWLRLRYMLKAELPMAGVLCGGVLLNGLLLRQFHHFVQILAILCCVCILTVFFSVVFLCMYYIFQPFTEEGNEIGFGYKFCSGALWVFAYACLQIDTPPAYFAALLLGVTVFGLLAALVLVWRLAPKTFRLK